MHTQHVKFSAYVTPGDGMGGVVAVFLVFEEGEVSGLLEDDDRSVLEVVVVVVVVVLFLPPSSFVLLLLLQLLLGFIVTIVRGLFMFSGDNWR
jgi:hypothetical protein